MKLWKKILIGVFVLAAIAVGLIGFGIFKAHKAYTDKIEPDMKRYVTMTRQEQDQYVLSKIGDLYGFVSQMDDSAKGKAAYDALMNDPAARQASLDWGRALCATIIKDDKDISAALSAADRAKYEKEAEDFDEKNQRFQKELERISPKIK